MIDYLDWVKSIGITYNSIDVGEFKLKNGKPYTGFIVTEPINRNQTVIRIPVSSYLTTKIAFFSDVQPIFLENPQLFSQSLEPYYEDNILLVYLLHENAKATKSRWYHLLQNLSKDIDYLSFWSDKELKELEDAELS